MSRKFSIVSTVNLDKLCDELEDYISCNGNFDPYIFMSEDTARAIAFEVGADDFSSKRDINDKIYDATCFGHAVFINNNLRFGIVEIR